MNKIIRSLYGYIGRDVSEIKRDMQLDFLTENVGRDAHDYYWFDDGKISVAIDIDTGAIITDEDRLEDLFC